jgi:glycosyltransferase involved in cell wall biosynthesis
VRVAVLVAGGPPNPTAGGGAVTAWTIVSQLLDWGHEVVVCALHDAEHYNPTGRGLDDDAKALGALGAEYFPVASASAAYFDSLPRDARARVRRAVRPPAEELYPNLVDHEQMHRAVTAAGAEVAFVYHFEALAASRALPIPRFAAVGDPPHLSALYRVRRRLPDPRALRGIVRLQAQLRRQPRVLVELLNECAACGAFAAHHARWLRDRGAAGAVYLHTPVPDPGPVVRTGGERPTILLVGHFKGVVTLKGLELFARQILPALERELGADGFEVRIAGGYTPPAELARLLDRPSVRLLGHVEEAGDEFRRADVMLVPNSISLGIRVRIITAFAYGTCVVTHSANRQGIPELHHGRNSLVGDSAAQLVSETLRALRDADLRRRVGAGGRETYDRDFRPEISVGRIADVLDQIRSAPANAPANALR